MDCNRFNENIFSYLEGSITPGMRKEMDEHLLSCHGCPVIMDGFSSEIAVIEEKKTAEPSPFISTRIMQRIESEHLSGTRAGRPAFSLYSRPVLATLIIFIGIVIGFSLGFIGNSAYTSGQKREARLEQIKAELSISDVAAGTETFFINN